MVYTSGWNYVNVTDSFGCTATDSVFVLINNTSTPISITDTSCDSYLWNGSTYNQSGIYIDTLTNTDGCDSIVEMEMTINNSISTTDSLVSCDSAMWNNLMYYTGGIYVYKLKTNEE